MLYIFALNPLRRKICIDLMISFWYTTWFLCISLLLLTVHVVLVIFVFLVYTASSELGSPSVVYQRLMEVSSRSRTCQEPLTHNGQACGPVSGNYNGSYLTMLSSGGFVFGIINIVGNFGTVFVDNVSSNYQIKVIRPSLLNAWHDMTREWDKNYNILSHTKRWKKVGQRVCEFRLCAKDVNTLLVLNIENNTRKVF